MGWKIPLSFEYSKKHIGNKFQNSENKEILEAPKGKGGKPTCRISTENRRGLSKGQKWEYGDIFKILRENGFHPKNRT